MIKKAYKYRIYPNKEQQEIIEKHFGCTRWTFNWGLAKKIQAYQAEQKTLSGFDLMKELTQLKKQPEYQWLNEVNSQSLQMALRNLDNAFTAFFRQHHRFPRFKSKKTSKSTFQIPQGLKLNDKLSIPKIPNIKIKLSREIEGKIKTATVSKTKTGKYFISIQVEQDKEFPKKPAIKPETTIGIDLGLTHFATISDGRQIENPRHLKKSLDKLKRQQRQLSRKKKGSNNRDKQRLKVAKIHEQVSNKRSDFLHKVTHSLTHENQVESIAIEDLGVGNMLKNHRLAQAISDVAWSEWRKQLGYKTDWYGKNLLTIGRFDPSSRLCNVCGTVNNELKLSDREWICKGCKTKHNRDDLASRNIKQFALIGSGRPKSPITLVESSRKKVS